MKTVRSVTCLIIALLVFSAFTPSTAFAKADATAPGIGTSTSSAATTAATTKPVKPTKLIVFNKTGGPLVVTLKGPQSYYFYAPNQGKTSFVIIPGKYTFTVTGCGGSTYTKTRSFKGGGTIGPMICIHH